MAFYGDGKHNEDMEHIDQQEDPMQQLIDEVIDVIEVDLLAGDQTVLEEILRFVPVKNLIQSLPEEQWDKYKGKF